MKATFSPDIDLMKILRHDIHQHPELGFEEFKTSMLVAELLVGWGFTVTKGIGGTGVVGQLTFGDGTGPKLGIRADMDALPITEATGLPWASQHPGRMHACGHDGHTAILLGAADVLAKYRDAPECPLNGILNLIFQPAEEVGGGGGAQRMIEDGLFDRFPCDAIFGLHNMPGTPVGQCFVRTGPFMCSSDKVKVNIQGKGGHGAMPHLATDPTVVAASILLGLQTIISRNLDPFHTGVVSVGRLHSGESYNIIPECCELELSVRALQPSARNTLKQRLTDLIQHQALAFDCQLDMQYEEGYPVLVNAEQPTAILVEVAQKVFGFDNVDADGQPISGSEDFAYMLQQVPGCYIMIGNGDNGHADGRHLGPCSVHNPHYDFNDENLPLGAKLWVTLAQKFLSDHQNT